MLVPVAGVPLTRDRSIYEEVPLLPVEEFVQLAPPEARSEEVLRDEHQLMLNRLSFELAERQRFASFSRLLAVPLTGIFLSGWTNAKSFSQPRETTY